MSLTAIQRMAEERLGLEVESLGTSALAKAVAERREALGHLEPHAYLERVSRHPEEFQALTEHLVVSETWFYRGGGLFDSVARRAGELIACDRVFRALCLPCSSGEEPYSLAIALTEAGLPPVRWQIDAVDVSPRAIAAAERAEYQDFAFRNCPEWLRERYFQTTARGWKLSSEVRERVRFRVGNALDPQPWNPPGYDLILCRNLLIYLTPGARRRVIDQLTQCLVWDGWIGVGHAEPSIFADTQFKPVGPIEHFLFTRSPEAVHPEPPVGSTKIAPQVVRPIAQALQARALVVPKQGAAVQPPKAGSPSLPLARQLADEGQLTQAVAECRRVLAVAGPSVEAYLLLGLIHQARGETEPASDHFRKALYLDPTNVEVLTHAMLLSEAAGRSDQAEAFRSRLTQATTGDQS